MSRTRNIVPTGKTVLLIDDERHYMHYYVDSLEAAGYRVHQERTIDGAKGFISSNKVDLAVIDVMLEGGDSGFDVRTGFEAGITIAKWIKANYNTIPFIGFSNSSNSEIIEFFSKYGRGFFFKPDWRPSGLVRHVNRILDPTRDQRDLTIFIVHGNNDARKLELKNYLQNILHLPEPIILHERPWHGRTIIEKFEAEAVDVDLAFILLTPDDIAAKASDSYEKKKRARQNVIFELGFFLGKLNRRSARVILLYDGPLELP